MTTAPTTAQNTNLNDAIAADMAAYLTETGGECSDDPNYAVECLWTPVSDRLTAFALRFPADVDAQHADVFSFLASLDQRRGSKTLKLSSSVRGKDLKYEGVPDHPHWSVIIIGEPIPR